MSTRALLIIDMQRGLLPGAYRESDLVLQKEACDAFYETELEARLRSFGVTEVVVTGLQTELCVDTTCRSALSRGFDLLLVEDGHSTGDSHLPAADIVDHHNKTLANLVHPRAAVRVLAAEAVSFDA
jgi:nicotinamidase-related amidase